jgi:NAD(P)-dependent dehydrogenase (short-subunit alcohol dehydrogenase family)
MVACADIQDAWASETARLVNEAGGTAIHLHCDVSSEDDVAAVIASAVSRFGRLDVMFNNAGVTGSRPGMRIEDYRGADVDRLIDINFRGVFYGCRQAVLQFKSQGEGGVIINTSSIAGLVGLGGVLYGATKGAVNQITRGVAIECASLGIRCNAICPGFMPLTNFILDSPDQAFEPPPSDYVDAVASLHPNGRIVTAQDCASAAIFLASEQARNITGVILPVDGGFVAR